MLKALLNGQDSSIHQILPNYNDQKGAYRFLRNKNVRESDLIDSMKKRCSNQVIGKDVLVLCDTTAVSVESRIGRITDFDGLGRIGTNQHKKSMGFHIHPLLVIDETNNTALGISSVKLIARPMNNRTKGPRKRGDLRPIPLAEKESNKWVQPSIESRDATLKKAKHITFVMDREGDMNEVFKSIPDKRTDIVVRSMHNRIILDNKGVAKKFHDHIKEDSVKKRYEIEINKKQKTDRNKVTSRNEKIKVCLKWGNLFLRPGKKYKELPPIKISYVEVKQEGENIKDPVHWIILSSKKITSNKKALEVIKIYQKRWSIELYFKLLKTDGFNIEKTELETGRGIRKLTLLIMNASIKILQLKSARNGQTDLKTEEVFTFKEIECLKKLNSKYEGRTEKQKNPYETKHLSWASWIIARMGGWSEFYDKGNPPGNKSFTRGLEKFETIMNVLDDIT